VRRCPGLSRYLTQKAVPDLRTAVLPALCLRLAGGSETASRAAGFQQQSAVCTRCIFSLSALPLSVVFKISLSLSLFFFFWSL